MVGEERGGAGWVTMGGDQATTGDRVEEVWWFSGTLVAREAYGKSWGTMGITTQEKIRSFQDSASPVVSLSPEQRRKSFVSVDAQGVVTLFNTTARRQAFTGQLAVDGARALAISPRGDALLIESGRGQMAVWAVENKHPEVSWSAQWSRVW